VKQFLTRNHAEDRVPQELELLVVTYPTAFECGLKLAGLGSMGESLLQQLGSSKAVSQYRLQHGNCL